MEESKKVDQKRKLDIQSRIQKDIKQNAVDAQRAEELLNIKDYYKM